jgi:type I restriction enzyme M protein
LPSDLTKDRAKFETLVADGAKRADIKLAAPIVKAILSALSERDETGAVCRDADGAPEPDPELRDTESVPLAEDIESFFAREVLPHVPDAWIDTARRDEKDGEVGIVGYEINFNRYFYLQAAAPAGGNRVRHSRHREGHCADAGGSHR